MFEPVPIIRVLDSRGSDYAGNETPASKLPRTAESETECVDSWIGLGLSTVGHVLVHDPDTQVGASRGDVLQAAADKPVEGEVLTLGALDGLRIEKSGAAARTCVQ